MTIKISIDMVCYYVMQMMSGWFNHHDLSADSLDEYEECVLEMKKHLTDCNDEKFAQLAFASLIETEDVSSEIWEAIEGAMNYPFEDREIQDILKYAYSVIWSDLSSEKAIDGYEIEFIKTGISIRNWMSVRDKLNPSFGHKS
jgi:hypothetical protein